MACSDLLILFTHIVSRKRVISASHSIGKSLRHVECNGV